jgi:putative zinc finger/helix-turn-helix YgiT family protein
MKTPSSRTKPRAPNDACPSCGATMVRASGTLSLPINGEAMAVRHISHLRCPACQETVTDLDDTRRLFEGAMATYRKKHGLLSAADIRAIRERFALTQGELAKLLHLGQNTLSRWEAGRNVQSSAMDVLLRLLRDVPGSLEYLRRLAA